MIHQPDLEIRWNQIKKSLPDTVFILIFFMMLANWGIESVKWKLLMRPLESISFFNAFKSVLAGCSITMLTPNRTGEFGGRILFVKPENRARAVSSAIFGSISQLLITFLMGTAGLIYFKLFLANKSQTIQANWIFNDVVMYVSLICSLVLMMIFFRLENFIHFLGRIRGFRRLILYLEAIVSYHRKDLLRILFYSFIRYSIFILQFALMLRLMNVEIGFRLMILLLAVFYLMMAILPTIGFTELPVRASASIVVLGLFSNNILGIGAAALGIWVVNLVIPSLIGGVFIIGAKIFKEK